MVYSNMTLRQRDIIKCILKSENFIDSDTLESNFNISKRTLGNEVAILKKVIDDLNGKLISKRGLGYKVIFEDRDTEIKAIKKLEIDCVNSYDNESRVDGILEILLKNNVLEFNKPIKLDEIAKKLYISLSTLKQDIKEVKRILEIYKLEISRVSNDGISINGEEVDIRGFISNYIFRKNKEFKFLDITDFQLLISDQSDLCTLVRDLVLEIIRKYKIELSDLGLKNLCTHIIIAIYRVKKGNFINYENLFFEIESNEYKAALELKKLLDEDFSVSLPNEEVAYLYQHLISQKKILSSSFKNELDYANDIYVTLNNCCKITYEYSGLDFWEDDIFRNGLVIHLNSALNRIRFGMNVENLMLEEIKVNYPYAYDIAVAFCNELEKQNCIKISEDETGFIALHFAGAIERMKLENKIDKYKTIVVCATGGGTSILLKAKLERKFKDFIEIKGFYPAFKLKEIDLSEYDLIITTIHLGKLDIPTINVSSILLEDDCMKISRYINKDKRSSCKDLFKEELFFIDLEFKTKEEIIDFMAKALYKNDYIDYEASKSFIDRERMASTEIGNMVSIPHSIKGIIKKEAVAIGILKNPIEWSKTKVQLVMMLAIIPSKSSENLFLEIYSGIDDMVKVNKLIKSSTLENFKINYIN